MQETALFILMYLIYPLWVAAGFTDWICHKRTNIAHTSGLKESLMHWLMFGEIGLAMLAVAAFEVNAAVLAIVFVVFIIHELTVYWDLHYTTPLRDVRPFEQMVHSFLEQLPLVSLALLAVSSWPQAQALVGVGSEAADWSLHFKAEPWPKSYLVIATLMFVVFNALPLLQEALSCWRVRRSNA